MADVSSKLLGQFVENLELDVLAATPASPRRRRRRVADAATAPTALRRRLVDAPAPTRSAHDRRAGGRAGRPRDGSPAAPWRSGVVPVLVAGAVVVGVVVWLAQPADAGAGRSRRASADPAAAAS